MRTIHRVIALTIGTAWCVAALAVSGVETATPPAGDNQTSAGQPVGTFVPEATDRNRGKILDTPDAVGPYTLGMFPYSAASASTEALLDTCPASSQVVLANNGFFVQTARAPVAIARFVRGYYLILGSELAANGLANGVSITGMGWNYFRPPGVTATAPLKLFLRNTTDTARDLPADFTAAFAAMTKVHDASTTLPDATGPFNITFSGGSPFTYTGGGLYVGFDWGNYPGTLAVPSGSNVGIIVNTTVAASGLFATDNAAAPVAFQVSSANRPETQMTSTPVVPDNDAAVNLVYSVGAFPNGPVGGLVVKALVSNPGAVVQTNLPVSVTVTGANAFTDTVIVPTLAPCGGTTLVTFAAYTPTNLGADTVTVSVPADGNNANNSKAKPLTASANKYSYKYPGSTADGGLGFNAATGQFATKFSTSSPTQVDSVNIEFFAASASTYKIAIYADNAGSPGIQLYEDAANRAPVAGPVSVRLPAPVAVAAGNFYVSVEQTAAVNMSLSFDLETPLRAGTFFFNNVPVGPPWGDFAPANAFKLNVGATLGACLAPMTVDVTPNAASTCQGSSILFTCTPSGGTGNYTYQWTENGIDIGGATSSTYLATHAGAGVFTYNCKVTDDGGCTNVQDATASVGTWLINGSACSDGNPCTGPDTCGGGTCQPGPNPCNDNDACTTDVCDGQGGCTHPAVDCNDNNACTTDGCLPASGCFHNNTNAPCSDGNVCTVGDACVNGVCVPGAVPAVRQFCNAASIAINDSVAPPTLATPYPSTIPVYMGASVICSATMSMTGLHHTFPTDIDMLLAGPAANIIVMSDVGGGPSAATVNLTISDSGATTIPRAGPLATGTFKPSNDNTAGDGTEAWPAPAPAPSAATAMSVFNGTTPTGNWNLFITDDFDQDFGAINGGWCVNLVAAPASCANGSQCNDGVACTADACINGSCTNTGSTTQVVHLKIGTLCGGGGCTNKHSIVWDAVAAGPPYDIIYGDLQLLHSAGVTASTGGCLGEDISSPSSDDTEDPPVDQGFWYLVRARNCVSGLGTYDEGGNQIASRDPLIPAPPTDCSRP